MARVVASMVSLLTLASAAPALAGAIGERAALYTAAGRGEDVRLSDLGAIHRVARALRVGGLSGAARDAARAEISLLADAILGDAWVAGAVTLDDLLAGGAAAGGIRVRATPGAVARDRAAYRFLALGYSARETADVVSGRISQRALDTARRMIAVGRAREQVGEYLDAAYRPGVALPNAASSIPPVTTAGPHGATALPRVAMPRPLRARAVAFSPGPVPAAGTASYTAVVGASPALLPDAVDQAPPRPLVAPSGPFDAFIAHYAHLHDVEVALVRAIIQIESAFNPHARSRSGAIGLMQLMPGTARALGVNPFVPEQNIEAGVRYFSQMLDTFGNVELALVAYNAGPGIAQRYARGQTALPGETRAYVRNVLERLTAAN